MSEKIILYDIPSRQGRCWSGSTWKTRLVLNFKGIPYKTEWIEYPDLQPTFEKWGIHPNSSGPYAYTAPAIKLLSGRYVMDSRKIADVLEFLHPTPSLQLDSPYQARIENFFDSLVMCVLPVFVPLLPKAYLNPASQAYFIPDRENNLGMSLDEYAKGAEKSLDDVKPYIKKLAVMYQEDTDGPFLMGTQPCYADLIVLAWLPMMDGVGWLGRIFELEGGDSLKKLYEAGGKWLERGSH